jgi:5-methylcytosine-specific restriction endonuclease McrA
MQKRNPVTHRTPAQTKKHNNTYGATKEAVAKRVKNNAARRVMLKSGGVAKGDGMDVDHIKPLRKGGSNKCSNLRVVSKERNRGWRDGV